ncbi:hypothetical protein BX666DRAFT_1876261 [Dichotomocladium elegans]|nr:hypothetical protein BX666DRAFT_1876261 [Dichotomocladium elegans]
MLALGTQYGVWVGPREGGASDFWLAVANDGCQQLGVLDGVVLLVQNRRGSLMAYDLEQICCCCPQPPSLRPAAGRPHCPHHHRRRRRRRRWGFICRSSVVSFAVGSVRKRPIIAYLIGGRPSNNTLVVLEYRTEWFRKIKEYRIGSRDARHVQIGHDAIFVQSPTMGICRVDEDGYRWRSSICPNMLGFVPLSSHAGFAYNSNTAWRVTFVDSASPPTDDNNIQPQIEFESVLQKAAIIYPYLIGFSPLVIEIKHMHSGQTAQILTGNHIRCVHMSYTDTEYPTIHATILHHEDHVTRVCSLIPLYCT